MAAAAKDLGLENLTIHLRGSSPSSPSVIEMEDLTVGLEDEISEAVTAEITSTSSNASGSPSWTTSIRDHSPEAPIELLEVNIIGAELNVSILEKLFPLSPLQRSHHFTCIMKMMDQVIITPTTKSLPKLTWDDSHRFLLGRLDLHCSLEFELMDRGQLIAQSAVSLADSKLHDGASHHLQLELQVINSKNSNNSSTNSSSSFLIGQLNVGLCLLGQEEVEFSFWKQLFELGDQDHDGVLNKGELEALLFLASKSDIVTSEMFEALFRDVEKGDGINFELFRSFMSKESNDAIRRLFSRSDFIWRASALLPPPSSPSSSSSSSTSPSPSNISLNPLSFFIKKDPSTPSPSHVSPTSPSTSPRRHSPPTLRDLLEHRDTRFKSALYPTLSPSRNNFNGNWSGEITVIDRASRRIFQEFVQPNAKLALKVMYSNSGGRFVFNKKIAKKLLRKMTESYGKRFTDPASIKEIPGFIQLHNLDLEEVRDPISSFKNFNEFFYRSLKAGARPIASPEDDRVAVSVADCRLNVFSSVDAATRLWIKGRNFSLAGLLADKELAHRFEGGSLAIFRLAPQDYHRYHVPVKGVIRETQWINGEYFTVNPIAVRTTVDVFTQNRRSVTLIDSKAFGTVAYVCIGATLVGSVNITVKEGQEVEKGDEFGYFAFGGSTIIIVFERNTIRFDEDLLINSSKPIETLIKMGESLGVSTKYSEQTSVSSAISTTTITAPSP